MTIKDNKDNKDNNPVNNEDNKDNKSVNNEKSHQISPNELFSNNIAKIIKLVDELMRYMMTMNGQYLCS